MLPWLIAVAFFMESLDTTILNTGVPTIAAALHVAPLSMKSVLASYTLSLAIFIPISGWMVGTASETLAMSASARAEYSRQRSASSHWGHFCAGYRATFI